MARAFRIIVILVVLLGGAWAALWVGASRYASQALNRASSAAANGASGADCANRRVGGFPWRLTIACGETALVASPQGVAARLAGLVADAPFYRPGFVATRLDGPLSVSGPGGLNAEATWQAAAANASAGIWPVGLRHTWGTVDDLKVTFTSNGALPIDGLTVGHGAAALGASPLYRDALRADIAFTTLKLVRSAGMELPEASGEARIDLVGTGGTVTRDLDRQIRNWLASGGKLALDHAALKLRGVEFSASGNLTVSPGGLLSGKLNIKLVGVDRVPDLVEIVRPDKRDEADQVVQYLLAISRPVDTEDGPTQELSTPITIRDGDVLIIAFGLLPFRLFKLPSLFELAGTHALAKG